MKKKKANLKPTLSLSTAVYGDLSLNHDPKLLQGGVRQGRPFVVSGVRKMHEPITIGRTVSIPVKEEPVRETIEVFFDDDEDPTDVVNPEYNGLVADNEFIVDQEEIDAVRDQKGTLEQPIRDAMKEMVALLYATDDASNYVEASMRDGLGFEYEPDTAFDDALVPLTRLSVLSSVITNLSSLTESSKKILLHKLSSKTADEIINSFNRKKLPEALMAMRKQYAATIKNAGVQPDLPIDEATVLGVRTSRS